MFFVSLCPLKNKQKICSFCLYVLNYTALYPQKFVFTSKSTYLFLLKLFRFLSQSPPTNICLNSSNSLTPALSKILHSFLLFYLFTLLLLNTSF